MGRLVVQIRGTSGSGKTTAVRSVMETTGDWSAVRAPGRKRPLYYLSASEWPPTAVLGHYETPTGGCDTVGSARAVYELIQSLPPTVENVLCEGLLLSEDVKWSSRLPSLRVLFLTTPAGECLEHVKSRREARGNLTELDPHNTVNRVGVIERARVKLISAGVVCRRCSARQAPGLILNWLREAARGGHRLERSARDR
jgi:hypothetical protein